MRMIGSFLVLLLGFAVTAGCNGGVQMLAAGPNTATNSGVISVWADWVKDKGDKYDVRLNIKNESAEPFIVLSREIEGFRGERRATVAHATFGIGERVIDLAPGEVKTLTLVVKHGAGIVGEYRLAIMRVHDNPTGDGKTLGTEVFEGVEWSMPDASGQ